MNGWTKNLIGNSGKRTGMKFRGKRLICDIAGSPISESADIFFLVISPSRVFVAFNALTSSFRLDFLLFSPRSYLWPSNAIQFWSLSPPKGMIGFNFVKKTLKSRQWIATPSFNSHSIHSSLKRCFDWRDKEKHKSLTFCSIFIFRTHQLLRKREDSQVPKRILLQAGRPYLVRVPSIYLPVPYLLSPRFAEVVTNKIKMHFVAVIGGDLKTICTQQ